MYTEKEGAWVLDVEGAVEKSKLDEFHNTNVTLLKERDDLKKRFEGIDPDQVRSLAEEKRKLEEAAQINPLRGVRGSLMPPCRRNNLAVLPPIGWRLGTTTTHHTTASFPHDFRGAKIALHS